MNYYNEFDRDAAAWLKELIAQGLIPKGDVDERDIRDVRPNELVGYTQCHFFAGIGGWSLALQLAGWPEDRPVWTASCPCQPFSNAGKGIGFADERHLWPAFFHLSCNAKPESTPVVGEQVASKAGLEWLDLVQADMEGTGHAFGAFDLCSPSVGTPNIRQRLWWVAVPSQPKSQEFVWELQSPGGGPIARNCSVSGMASTLLNGNRSIPRNSNCEKETIERGVWSTPGVIPSTGDYGAISGLPDTDGGHPSAKWEQCGGEQRLQPSDSLNVWSNPVWLPCRDGVYRPIERTPVGLADGLSDLLGFSGDFLCPLIEKSDANQVGKEEAWARSKSRSVRLRGYGNAINPYVGKEFIEAVMEFLEEGGE